MSAPSSPDVEVAPGSPSDTELDELLEAARDAARAASRVLASARPEAVRTKSNPRDLVTEWDLRSEEILRARLAQRAPGIPFHGEEGGGEPGGAAAGGLRWVVDPIDGTVNFSHGLPLWTVSIGLEAAGAAVAGVVVAPALGWTFWARRGGGAWADLGAGTERLAVSTTARLAQAMLVSGFPYDLATRADNNFAQWEHFQRIAGACRRLGSASLDLCMVARGWFDGYWERHLMAWDVAAGAVLVAEAGGRVTDTRGGRFHPGGGEVVATNGAIHEEVLAELAVADAGAQSRTHG